MSDHVKFRLSLGVLAADPRLQALIADEIPVAIQAVLFATSRDEITVALAETAEMIGFAHTMGDKGAAIERYWTDIQHAQYVLLKHWREPFDPAASKRGRPPRFLSREEFQEAVKLAILHQMESRRYGKTPSKRSIAKEIGTTSRQLRTWEVRFHVNVSTLLSP